MRRILWCMWLISASLQGCGTNLFSLAETKDPGEEAAAYLDRQEPDEAIDILERALKDQPENWTLVSLMASAKAQKAGIDTTSLAIKLATQKTEASNELLALFAVLPDASEGSLTLMADAVRYLASIPSDERIPADMFKASLFGTAYTALQVRFFDSDGSGTFTIEELSQLSDEAASTIIETLLNAESSAGTYKTADGTEVSIEKIASIRSQIDSQPGSTQAEKLRNFLGVKVSPTASE